MWSFGFWILGVLAFFQIFIKRSLSVALVFKNETQSKDEESNDKKERWITLV